MRRFYIPPDQLGKEVATVKGSDARHLRDVLRLQPNDRVIVFDGSGRQYQAQIVSVDRKAVKIAIQPSVSSDIEPMPILTLAQGYLKDKKMDNLVRHLTELGVGRWVPYLSQRSIPHPDHQRLLSRYRRWQKISIEALKQCGRNRAMEICPLATYEEVLKQARSHDLKIIFWEASKGETLTRHVRIAQPASVFCMVGPEGGFSAQEISEAEDEGFLCVGLGPRILRAETASLAAASLVQFVFGDMG